MSWVESHLCLLDSIVRSPESLCESELCCLGRKMKDSALCLEYEIYYRADHPLHECLHHFVAARNIRAPASCSR